MRIDIEIESLIPPLIICIPNAYFQVLKHLGEWGPYQKFLFTLLCIPACLPAAFLAFNQVLFELISVFQ